MGLTDLGAISFLIGADSTPFNAAIAAAKKSITNAKPHFDALGSIARKSFYGLTGAGTTAAYAFAEAEQEDIKLRAALSATGQEVTGNMSRLNDFATAISRVTTVDDDAAKGLMAYATNLGVTADGLEVVTKAGIGLGTTLFGGDAKAGVDAVSKAYNGNFRALEKLIPGMKDASTNAEKWAMVQRAGESGFKQAQALAGGLAGRITQLWNETGNVVEMFGEMLAPAIGKAIAMLKAITIRIQSMSPAQKEQIVQWGLVATGIAAVVGFGPGILRFAGSAVSGFAAIAKVAMSLGTTLITGIFSPIGLIVGGFALLITGFAYFAGTGDTALGRVADGFKRLWDFVKFVFANATSVSEAFSLAMGGIGYIMSDAWVNASALLQTTWATISTHFRAVWEDLQHIVTNAVISSTEFFVSSWNAALEAHRQATVTTANFMVDAWNGGKKAFIAVQESMGMISKDEADKRRAELEQNDTYLADMRKKQEASEQQAAKEKTATNKQFFDEMKKNEAKANEKNLAGIGGDEAKKKAEIEAERVAKLAENAKGNDAFKADAEAKFKASGKASLNDQIEDLYKRAKSGLGIDGMLKMVDELKGEADKLQTESLDASDRIKYSGKEKKAKEGKEKKEKEDKNQTMDIESAFKADLVRSLAAADALKGAKNPLDIAQDQLDAQKEAIKWAAQTAKDIATLVKNKAKLVLG